MASPNSRCENLFRLFLLIVYFIPLFYYATWTLNLLLLRLLIIDLLFFLYSSTTRIVISEWFVLDISEFVSWHVFWLYFDFFKNLIKLTFIITEMDSAAITKVIHLKDPIASPAPPMSFIFDFLLLFLFSFRLLNWPLICFLFLIRFPIARSLFWRSFIVTSFCLLMLV